MLVVGGVHIGGSGKGVHSEFIHELEKRSFDPITSMGLVN